MLATALGWAGEELREEFHNSFPLAATGRVSLANVNGAVVVRRPQGAGMCLSASTVNGSLESDFDLPVRRVGFGPGRHGEAMLSQGGTQVSRRTVNGSVRLQRR